ncbi:PKD-like domain-containing protein [Bacteroides acidifaciens]|uniref:PKD-like domain-containing protein n=1 Tax=Bacteroides acidifaciens TaxID=85831 RepID=UPI00259A3755|nr:PKD-like domain-containing protein [Bacteroides acidifaciens]
MNRYLLAIFIIFIALTSCNKDDNLYDNNGLPSVEFDSETGIYTVKQGRSITIIPEYKNVNNAVFAWTIDGRLVSTSQSLTFTSDEIGDYFVTLRVDTEVGSVKDEIKIEVVDLLPPTISFLLPPQGLKVKKGTDYSLAPEIQNDDDDNFEIEWIINNKVVGREKTYVFNEDKIGEYTVTINASNDDGKTSYDLKIQVLESEPFVVSFLKPYYLAEENVRYVYPGQSVFLRPHLEYFTNPTFKWSVDGKEIADASSQTYAFTPSSPGNYMVTVTVTENSEHSDASVSTTAKIVCVTGSPADKYRPLTTSSVQKCNKVYEFTPAPGQFIYAGGTFGYTGNETTMELAIAFAERNLANEWYVSLGAWGGSMIVGFDHSIKNLKGDDYDFAVQGNAFATSNEPGIVWVMQDTNGNGLPDDEWYELRGSETGKSTTIQDYEVTYFRPAPYAMHNRYIDCFGKEGSVLRNQYHSQEYYYPLWMSESYTIRGTLIPGTMSNSGHAPYQWGYVDNVGNDSFEEPYSNGTAQKNGFKISNAMYPDGTPIMLDYIDFVKVQCAVQEYHVSFGEVSTEVFSIEDRNSLKNK